MAPAILYLVTTLVSAMVSSFSSSELLREEAEDDLTDAGILLIRFPKLYLSVHTKIEELISYKQ